jgi:hypothetical protein
MPKYEDASPEDKNNPLFDDGDEEGGGEEADIQEELDLDSFLDFSDRAKFGGSVLKGWKKDKRIVVFHHRTFMITPLWSHQWPAVVERKGEDEDDDDEKEIWMRRWVCHEGLEVLRHQFHRDQKTKARKMPPCDCPKCRFDEWLYQQVQLLETITTFAPVFEFTDPEVTKSLVLYAAPMLNIKFGKNNPLTPEQKKEARVAGIELKQLFKMNTMPRMNYLFDVIVAKDPEEVQIAIESAGLGNAIKAAVQAERRKAELGPKRDPDYGDPRKHPYAFEWTYDEDAPPQDKYKVVPLRDTQPDDDILALIDGDRPDSKNIRTRGNIEKLRADMESFCVLGDKSPNWDDIFNVRKTTVQVPAAKKSEPDAKAPSKPDAKPTTATKATSPTKAAEPAKGKPAAKKPEAPEEVGCTVCDQPMSVDDVVCPHCATEYDVDGQVEKVACKADGCEGQVDVTEVRDDGGNAICAKCGTVHVVKTTKDDNGTLLKYELMPKAAKAATRRRGA